MVHYIAGYADEEQIDRRKCSLAGVAKMNYVIGCLKLLKDYRVYSISQTKKERQVHGTGKLKYRYSIPSHNKYGFYLDLVLAIIQMVFYLLRVPRTDTVLSYHERFYTPWIARIHRVKKWNWICEVEEIYTAVANRDANEIAKEVKYLKQADSYILSTLALKDGLELAKTQRYIVCNGVYMPIYSGEKEAEDDKIHIVYAGSLNYAKGVHIAIESMELLNETYILHVSGSGTEQDIQEVQNLIARNSRGENIIFEGCMPEAEHLKLLQKCDIGLCPANPNAAFPSKILEYMRNGMKVVSVRKPEIESAECSQYLYYFEEEDRQGFAEAIIRAGKAHDKDIKMAMEKMHEKFLSEFKKMITF